MNKSADNQLPFPVAIVYGMDIEPKDKQTLRNFCEDFLIENVPQDKYLSLPVAVVTEVKEDDPVGVQTIFAGPVRISNFMIREEHGDNGRMLVVEYESAIMERYYHMIADMYSEVDHDPELTFVLCYHYEGDHDLENLSYHLNRYLPIITASGDISGLYDDTETNAIMLGIDELE